MIRTELFKKAVDNTVKGSFKKSYNIVRTGTITFISPDTKYCSIQFDNSSDTVENVKIPNYIENVSVGLDCVVVSNDPNFSTKNRLIYVGDQRPVVSNSSWTSWSPSWGNLVVGNATVTAYYKQIGKTVFFRVSLVFGNTTSITGNPLIVSLPVSPATYPVATPLGLVRILDSDLSVTYTAQVNSAGIIALWDVNTSSYLRTAAITSTIPFTWTTDDQIGVQGVYESA